MFLYSYALLYPLRGYGKDTTDYVTNPWTEGESSTLPT